MSEPKNDPRVRVASFVVYPTGYDDLVHSDKDMWCLTVTDGHKWGWAISQGRGMVSSIGCHMNRKGEFIYEQRRSEANKHRRYPLDEALRIALKYVDTIRVNGRTASEASAHIAARLAATP